MHFGEYELSPSLISLSPLPSSHPEAFQRLLVRTSIWCYPDFILDKGRSLVSLFCSKCFSPFPHGTGTLSVSREYLALPDGPGRFRQDSSCPALLRIPLCFVSLRIPGYHRLRPNFPDRSPHEMSCNVAVLQPRIRRNGYGLGSSPFARHYWGNHCLFSVPAGTKMFQFPALASIIDGWYLFKVPGCPIRKSADRRSFAPPRGLSQLITSFIASESQGIRHAPLRITDSNR